MCKEEIRKESRKYFKLIEADTRHIKIHGIPVSAIIRGKFALNIYMRKEYMSDKELVSRKHKDLLQFNNKVTNNLIFLRGPKTEYNPSQKKTYK